MSQVFNTQMDNTVKMITIITHCAVIPIPLVLFFQAGLVLALLNLSILVTVFGLAYLFRPFQYVLDEKKLTIHKLIAPKKIDLINIQSISTIDYKELSVRWRLWGSGGLWGWFGIFVSAEYGNINLQITEKNNLILIITKDNKFIVLSPTKPIDFAEATKKAIQQVNSIKR